MILPNQEPLSSTKFTLLNYNKDLFEIPSLIIDSNRKVLAYNYQFLNLFNLLDNEIKNISLHHLLSNLLNFNILTEKLYKKPFVEEMFELLHHFKNGKQIQLKISINKVLNRNRSSELILVKFNII